jgi:hypothetical protein
MSVQEAVVPTNGSLPESNPAHKIGWPPGVENYMNWLAVPQQFRGNGVPLDEKEYSAQTGISRHQLMQFRKIPGFLVELKQRQRDWFDAQEESIEGAIVQSALIPGREGFQDRKLYKQLQGRLVDRVKLEQDVTVRTVEGQSKNEVIDNLERALNGVRDAIEREYEEESGPPKVLTEGDGFTVIDPIETPEKIPVIRNGADEHD